MALPDDLPDFLAQVEDVTPTVSGRRKKKRKTQARRPHAHAFSPTTLPNPQLPEPAVAHLLRTAGFTSDDPLLTRLIAVAGQRFAASVAHDALQVERRRALRPGAGAAAAARRAGGGRRSVLAVEDLSEALQEVGVALTRPPYLASGAVGGGGGGGGTRGRRKPA